MFGPRGFSCAPCGARFQPVQVRNLPDSGKDIAEVKDVHCEVESEGRWMLGKILTRRANPWSDEQKSHIRHLSYYFPVFFGLVGRFDRFLPTIFQLS